MKVLLWVALWVVALWGIWQLPADDGLRFLLLLFAGAAIVFLAAEYD